MPYLLARMSILLLRSHVGRLAVGGLLILGGIIYGLTSHHVNYVPVPQGKYHVTAMTDGTYGFVLDGTDTYYIVHPTDFNPVPDDNAFKNTDGIGEVLYKDEDPQSFVMHNDDGSQVNSQELTVVSFTLTSSKDQKEYRFTTGDYLSHPDGFDDNRWPVGVLVAALGLGLLGFFLMWPAMQARRQQRQNRAFMPVGPQPVAGTPSFAPPSVPYVPPVIPEPGQEWRN
ncbi:hypothetical protein [Dictyobacter aurantiacus]|uniref:Uncharacterized protein n=1 Tax=Dictyobacter aurantiacus TaxID=1936993 RepID=A0A401ZDR3_9CHLR|nr:hypothetical protein [Dictyobacter aurantiacus]GCE05020.1 hypothetical protein KDAU_23490 [Dictyobacter aurantiacus]